MEFVRFCNGLYRMIYYFEPNDANARLAKENLKSYKNIEVSQSGLWAESKKIYSWSDGSASTHIVAEDVVKDGPMSYINAVAIDNMEIDTLVTFFKLDVEGAEIGAIKGAQKTILRDKPTLAICLYHGVPDLFEIPHLIHSIGPAYKLYVRHYSNNYCETVLYAVP